jgi:hypothetical protein
MIYPIVCKVVWRDFLAFPEMAKIIIFWDEKLGVLELLN